MPKKHDTYAYSKLLFDDTHDSHPTNVGFF